MVLAGNLQVANCGELETLNLQNLQIAGNIEVSQTSIENLDLPNCNTIGGALTLEDNQQMAEVTVSNLDSVGFLRLVNQDSIQNFCTAECTSVGDASDIVDLVSDITRDSIQVCDNVSGNLCERVDPITGATSSCALDDLTCADYSNPNAIEGDTFLL